MLASEVCLVCLLSLSSLVASFVSVIMVPIVLSNTSIRLHEQPSELPNCNITLSYHKWSPQKKPPPQLSRPFVAEKAVSLDHPWHCRWSSLQPSMARQHH